MSTLERAIAIAAQAHAGQVDKAGAAYITHPLRVMHRVSSAEARMVAVLHDVVEDTPVTFQDLREAGFSTEVLTALDAVTKRDGEAYEDFVRRAARDPIGREVKLADLADNCDLSRIANPTMRDLERIHKYRHAIRMLQAGPDAADAWPFPTPATVALADALRAAVYAAHKHRDQRRKDAEASPYINHPLALADILAREGGISDGATLCAALLHDTIEDTDTTMSDLEGAFGMEVASIVREVTDDKTLPKEERKRLQVEHAVHLSDKAKLVKLADKIANLRDVANSPPADWTLERRREYFDWALAVVNRLRGVHQQLEATFDEAFAARP